MTTNDNKQFIGPVRAIIGVLLAWIVPGAGHAFVGRPGRGIIIFLIIGAIFWAGVGMGGVMTVDHRGQKWWFAAEMLTGVHGLVGWQRESKVMEEIAPQIERALEIRKEEHRDTIQENTRQTKECDRQIAEANAEFRAAPNTDEQKRLKGKLDGLKDSRNKLVKIRNNENAELYTFHSELIIQALTKKEIVLVEPVATLARAYAGVAGLLNLMCMFDVVMLALIGRVETAKPSDRKEDQ